MIIKARGTVIVPSKLRSLGQIVSWGKQVNKAIQQLRDRAWDVPNGARSGGGGGGDKRFKLALNVAEQKLTISPGLVTGNPKKISLVDGGSSNIIEPIEPKVNGVKISEADGLDITPYETGKTYGVYCIANDSAANIRIKEKATYKPAADQTAFLIGTFKLKTESGQKVLDGPINQRWLSDIVLTDEDVQNDSDSGFNSDESREDSELGSSDEASIIIDDNSGSSGSQDESEEEVECPVIADLDLNPRTIKSCYAFPKNNFTGTSQQVVDVRLRTLIKGLNLCACTGWQVLVTIYGARPDNAAQSGQVFGESLLVNVPCQGDTMSRTLSFLFYSTEPCAIHHWKLEIKSETPPPPGPLDPPSNTYCCGKTYIVNSGSPGHAPIKLPRRCGSSSCSTD